MEGDMSGVRITPPVLEFYDTEPNITQQLNITVKNISKTSKTIRFYGPKTKHYKLKVKNPEKPVAPGLCIPAVVEYESSDAVEISDRLVVTVDGDIVEIPLMAYPSQAVLEIENTVDFGSQVASSKTISHEIALVNHGSMAGEFKIKYSGDQPLAIIPNTGTVPPKSVQLIKVEYVTKIPGKFCENAEVKLEGQESKTLTIKGHMVQRALEIVSLETEEKLNCVKFGCTYYGSDLTECALLYNNGPESVNFVAVLDEDAIAQEMGVDLTQSATAALAHESSTGRDAAGQGHTNKLTSLITAIPNQGVLKPYQKIPVFFRFSPRWDASRQGWKSHVAAPPRKDFSLFMRIQIVGSSSQDDDTSENGTSVEIALTGTALPVLLTLSPAYKFDFGECPVGEHADILCTIKNESTALPATFQFRRVAHFTAHPPNGKIPPSHTQDVIFSFAPKQVGSFKPKQMLDVVGQIADGRNPTLASLQVINSLVIQLLGQSNPVPLQRKPKFNPGITPYISNEVGMFVDTTFSTLEKDNPRNAIVGGPHSVLHAPATSFQNNDSSVKVAFPNDRARSIRPSNRHDKYKTLFTRTPRHTYVDPDYALSDDEEYMKGNHRGSYVALLRHMKKKRQQHSRVKEYAETNNKLDIGIKTAAGLKPKELAVSDIQPDQPSPTPPNVNWKLLSTKKLTEAELETSMKSVCEGLNAVPSTNKEKAECTKILSPQQLHQVVIGPANIEFGQVCLRSINTRNLSVTNNLDQYIHIVAEIDCKELRQSSPLSQVVPPKSKAHIPIIFESNTKGKFQRSVSYSVNSFYKHHVTVMAEVVSVSLSLSTDELILRPTAGLPADAGFRGVITLYNKLNYPAEFTWAPNLGDRGTAFSVRPATGIVDAHKDLDCEVVWHPSYLAPDDGSFSLMIHGGNTLQLNCQAELGPTSVQFVERRIMFGQVPINVTTTRTVLLANTGQNHAFFQVLDPSPFPGLTVSPIHGLVPVGGYAELKVQLTPTNVLKFDTRVQVSIKSGKILELRMGGTVEPPSVDIDMDTFNFGGVYCGSGATLPFKLNNEASTKARLELDLTRYKDFTLNFPGYQTQDDYSFQLLNAGLFTVTLNPEETVEGELIFMPTEVAAYDFIMPVAINHMGAPSPAPTPAPPTPAPSIKNSLQHIINPRPLPMSITTPRKHVIATALRQPLQLSSNRIEFFLPFAYLADTATSGLGTTKGTLLVNNSDKPLKWTFDLRNSNKALDEGVIKFLHSSGVPFVSLNQKENKGVEGTLNPGQTQKILVMFCPKEGGKYECLIPIIIDDNFEKPYQYLHVIAELKAPKMWFDPLAIVMTPVPLATEVSNEFMLLATQYTKVTEINVEVPKVECEDGSLVSPLTVTFLEGQEIQPCIGDEPESEPFALACKLSFSCQYPVSFCEPVKFLDSYGGSFSLMVTATADNCLMTCYPFLALHRTDHQIVCKQGDNRKQKFTNRDSSPREKLKYREPSIADVDTSQTVADEDDSETVEIDPAIIEAGEFALNDIDIKDIQQIKSFLNPPQMVIVVLEAVSALLNTEGKGNAWKTCLWMLKDPRAFLEKLKNLDIYNISPVIMKKVRESYIANPEFNPDSIKSKSMACSGLCKWVLAVEMHDRLATAVGSKKQKITKSPEKPVQMKTDTMPKARKTVSKDGFGVGEAVFVPCQSPPHTSRPSTSATSSNFQISSSSYESSASITDSTDMSPAVRDGAMNNPPSASECYSRPQPDLVSRSLGSAMFPDEDSEEGIFHMEVLLSVQRWFSSQGWPGGPFPIVIPQSLRSGLTKKPAGDDAGNSKSGSWDTNNLKKEFKTVYDMIGHLSGRPVPGIPLNSPLPSDPVEKVKQIYWQHSTLITFMRCQGASVAAIKPEYLMEPGDYLLWKQLRKQMKIELLKQGEEEEAAKMSEEEELEEEVFEAVSKRSWTDILLQLLKTLVLAKVTPNSLKYSESPTTDTKELSVNTDPLCSNIYSTGERVILAWLNHHYEQCRKSIWEDCGKGGIPPSRWIVNFDFDLLDGLVLAALFGAYMPFLVKSHLQDMYTHPSTAEQCLHNALRVVSAMKYAGIEYDIQAIDITDPNPISLLLLCVFLFEKLPQYLPKTSVEFTGGLHVPVTRQVKLSNPSSKPLIYNVLTAGTDACDFHIAKGPTVTIPPKSTLPLSIQFTSRFLRPAEAILVLVGRRQGSAVGTTLTFNLRTQIDSIIPKSTVQCEAPCYELEKVPLTILNPFDEGGEFRIMLVEGNGGLLDPINNKTVVKRREKRKKVKAKIDNGLRRPETPPTPPPIPPPKVQETSEQTKVDSGLSMSAFFSPLLSVDLDPKGGATFDIHYLPFTVGKRQCSVIFLNEQVGEFIYSLDATATLPLSSGVPFVRSMHSVRISSAAAAETGRGMFGGDDRVVYWKCEAGQTLQENIMIPVTNIARERALMIAAQQHMCDVELKRRQIADTLHSSTVMVQTVKLLSGKAKSLDQAHDECKPPSNKFSVECDSEFYSLPKTIILSPLAALKSRSAPPQRTSYHDMELNDGSVELPVKFIAKDPGHYPCQVTLRAKDDVRVYKIECTVSPEGSTAEIEFKAPVHQSVTQCIPVVNLTNHDWPLQALIEGIGFHGPSTILAKAYQTTKYPLVFKPKNECDIVGRLVLTNTDDGTEHLFYLSGIAEKPLALENVVLKCEAKKSSTLSLKVPNMTKKKLCYKVESDLTFISGNPSVTVLSGQTGSYDLLVNPIKRGHFKGIVAFIAGKNPVIEVDSDGDEVADEDEETKEFYGYRVWYSFEVFVKPPQPERVIPVTCACQKKAILEVVVCNPTSEQIDLSASIEGRDLTGTSSVSLQPGAKDIYVLTFTPSVIGRTRGSLIFYHDLVGEFWYDLRLMAESPPTTTLPHLECELGRWTQQMIVLENPTDEPLELIPTVSNSNNFTLERDNERPIILPAGSKLEVPLHFMPSTLGKGDHLAKIIFHSEQLGEWEFVASGSGLLPQPQDPVSVCSSAGSNTTLIIPFRNPMDHAVLVDVSLRDNKTKKDELDEKTESPFCLLLKHSTAIRVGPKSTLDIPVCFAPMEMKMYEAYCAIAVHREDGGQWDLDPKDSQRSKEIRWLFPIHGIPEFRPLSDAPGAVVECKARDRLEERLEVTLAGVAPSTSGPQKPIRKRAITPKSADKEPFTPNGIVVGETLATAEEFSFDLDFGTERGKENVQNSVALSFVGQHRETATGLVILSFNVVFAPFVPMEHDAQLVVKAATGGVWKFPLRFLATEPVVDDVITIEAVGLNKESSIGFRMTSQTIHPILFNAYFSAGSDSEFTVSPSSGELLPVGTSGTLLTINFLPSVYGKLHQARLIIQTADMQWSYTVKGIPPQYSPPRGRSSQPMAGPHPDPRVRIQPVNYIQNNTKLLTTAVSSPIKGAPILRRTKCVV